jgi:hypothetical protein
MKLRFTQSGGFAGLIRQCTIDTETMKPDEAAALEGLVRQASLSASRQALSRSARDLEEYEIAIDRDGKSVTVVLDQSTLPAEAKPLVAYLKKSTRPGGAQ